MQAFDLSPFAAGPRPDAQGLPSPTDPGGPSEQGAGQGSRPLDRPTARLHGSALSAAALRATIRSLIEAESPRAPLSDVAITRLLAEQGLVIARRTVTKYRQQMRIDPVERRRLPAARAVGFHATSLR